MTESLLTHCIGCVYTIDNIAITRHQGRQWAVNLHHIQVHRVAGLDLRLCCTFSQDPHPNRLHPIAPPGWRWCPLQRHHFHRCAVRGIFLYRSITALHVTCSVEHLFVSLDLSATCAACFCLPFGNNCVATTAFNTLTVCGATGHRGRSDTAACSDRTNSAI